MNDTTTAAFEELQHELNNLRMGLSTQVQRLPSGPTRQRITNEVQVHVHLVQKTLDEMKRLLG